MFKSRRIHRIEDDLDGAPAWIVAGLAELEQHLARWASFEAWCVARAEGRADPDRPHKGVA